MRLITVFTLISLVCNFTTNAQTIISHFTWDTNPVTQALVGPNATSVSSSATSDINGVGGTNGLNPGSPKMDINMDIPGSPTFDVQGIDISIDFQREESRGDFVSRGNNLVFGMNGGNLSIVFRIDDGIGGYINVNSGNIYSIPNDDVFRTYRFYYLPTTGFAEVLVDGVSIWTYAGTPGLNLYWTGAGNLRVGNAMDASGSDETVFDNLIIASVINSPLPVTLLDFKVTPEDESKVKVEWSTASEQNNDYFEVLRSENGYDFESIAVIEGHGNSSSILHYSCIDQNPLEGISYYRLKQVDDDGETKFYDIKSVEIMDQSKFLIYPNPVQLGGQINMQSFGKDIDRVSIYNTAGQLIVEKVFENQSQFIFSTENISIGTYLILVQAENRIYREKLIIK